MKTFFDEFRADLRRPATTIGLILAVLGFLPVLYSVLYAREGATLMLHQEYYVAYAPGSPLGFRNTGLPNPDRRLTPTTLPDPPFRIVARDGSEIKTPIWDVQISVWNGGNVSLGADRIRKPLVFNIASADKILGVRVLHDEPKDGVRATIIAGERESVAVDWKYMDPGKGFKIAVIFTGEKPGDVEWDGYIDGKIEDTRKGAFSRYLPQILTTAIIVLAVGTLLFGYADAARSPRATVLISLGVPLLTVLTSVGLVTFLMRVASPPF